MPRGARRCPGGFVYHVLNRGNDRKTIFHKQGDARAFVQLLGEAKERVPGLRLLAWCLMRNHWHLALHPSSDGDITAFMSWLANAHVRRYRQHSETNGEGHLYQGRFKSFPVGTEDHDLLTVLRYIEANALRAGLVDRAEDWRWSSLHSWVHGEWPGLLDEWPIARPANWLEIVNEPIGAAELHRVRESVDRSSPFGSEEWVRKSAELFGVSLRRPGRPRRDDQGDVQNIPPQTPTTTDPLGSPSNPKL
jgi:putative transposase